MLTHIKTISKFTIIEAMRNRLVLLTLLVMGISFGMIEFIGDLSITERRVTQVAILAAFLRLSAMVIITMFVMWLFSCRYYSCLCCWYMRQLNKC